MKSNFFLPEGYAPLSSIPVPLSLIQQYIEQEEIVEGLACRCDGHQTIHVTFRGYEGILPREEVIHPDISGAGKDIAVLSRVGHSIQFMITGYTVDGGGKPILHLSRKKAQENALSYLLDHAVPGTVLPGRITHLESFGAFVDIGCGVIALLPLEYISVGRIQHPAQRFTRGQKIRVVVKSVHKIDKRFTLTHKELLGTWLENAALFAPGETVTGFVRSIKEYGAFVELTPNLSGLADLRPGIVENDPVTVFIRSIRPQQMKIKLQILQKAPDLIQPPPPVYYITDGCLQRWEYAPPGCEKPYPPTVFSL